MTISKAKVIKDYEKLSDELLERLKEEYPNGYSNYIIQFPNKAGKMVRAIELETEDTLYMIRLPESVSGIGYDDIEVEEDDDIIADEVFDDNFEVGSTVAIKDIEEEITEEEEEENFENEDKQESNEDEFEEENFDISDEDFLDDDDFDDDDYDDEELDLL